MLGEKFRSVFEISNRPGLARDLIAGGIGNICVKFLQIPLAMALSVILARTLGPAGYGVYAYVFTLASILVVVAQFGLPKLIIRETASAHALDDTGAIRHVWVWSLMVGTSVTAIVSVLAVTALMLLRGVFSGEEIATGLLGVALLPLMVFSSLLGGALRGLRRVVAGQLPDIVFRPGLFLLLVIVLLWFWDKPLTSSRAIELHVIAAGISCVAAGLLLLRYWPEGFFSATVGANHGRGWFAAVAPFIVISGSYQVNQYTDILMLGIFGKSEQVGVYRVAVQIALLSIIGLQAVQMLAQPYIARLHRQGNRTRLKKLLKLSSRGAFFWGLLILISVAVIGKKLIINVFGVDYVACYVPLLILMTGQLTNTFFGVVNVLLEMTGHQNDSARAFLFGAGCNIVLNLVLIPIFGLIGAATATAISMLVWNVLLWRSAHCRLGLETTAVSFRNLK